MCGGLLTSCAESPRFQRLNSEQTGIDFANTVMETDSFHILSNEYIYNGAGVGITDFNNDGLQDILFTGNEVSTQVFLNLGDFKFKNITSNFEGLTNDQWYSGVTIADINGDGSPDVYLTSTTYEGPENRMNRLWISQESNDGEIPFYQELAEAYGIADTGYSVDAAFLDYDLDGDLDLYILNNTIDKSVSFSYRKKIDDGSSINNDKFYRNNGDGTFSDVTIEAGITVEGNGLGLAISDLNKDGYPDVYITNDYLSNELMYINQQDGTFKNEIGKYLSYQSKFSMGNDISDMNNDGYPDIMSLDMMPEQYFRKKQTINGHSYFFYINDEKFGFEHQYIRNMLHIHNGMLNGEMIPYSEVGQMEGIYQTEWSWSALFADYDNDGDKDLLVTNGFPKDPTDKDFVNYKAQVYGFVASADMVIYRMPVVETSNYAFENTGDFHFKDQTAAWGMDIPSFSNGASFVDLDNDGDLDYVVNNLNSEAFVYKNNSVTDSNKEANYIQLRLTGERQNTDAIGAKVEIWYNGQYQFYEHFLSRGYVSSVDPHIHFGLADITLVDSIRVTWPLGKTCSVLTNIAANQVIEIGENTAKPFNNRNDLIGQYAKLFKQTKDTIGYTHKQTDYIDFFQNQNIIQHKFSQIGPVLARGDLDGDGLDDLIIGATNALPTQVFLRKGNGFEKADFEGLTELKRCPESGLSVVDIDGDGDNDVVALAGGYTNEDPEDYRHYIYFNNNGSFSKYKIPTPSFPASTVKAFDYDHDGDVDLFIGARVTKGSFPLAAHSYLMINNSGEFNTEVPIKFDLGMVTDATWSDYDGDGWEDLVITREWNSLAILRNIEGQKLALQSNSEIEKNHGLWNTVVSGDFDQDGDDDYIVGNLGENHRFTVNDLYPMNLYAKDLDGNGSIDPLTTGFWKDPEGKMKEFPVNYLDELAAQSSYFREIFESYTAFSYLTIDDILNREEFPEEKKYHINTSSSFVLWNDGGKFRWVRLPSPIQTSPVKSMLVRDFNGDQYPDVLVAGNDYTFDVSTGYYDANKGFIMLSKGKESSFEILTPTESGMLLNGQVESLLYFKGDTSLVVAGINREKIEIFIHNQ